MIMSPDLPWLQAVEGACLAKHGHRKEAASVLAELDSDPQDPICGRLFYGRAAGRPGRSRSGLSGTGTRVITRKSPVLFAMSVDPRLDNLREDPRFAALVARVFPQQRRTAGR